MSRNHELEPFRDTEVFVVLDLDRTMLDTDKLNRLLCMYIEKTHDASPDDGDPYEYTLAREGESFSLVPYMIKRYSQEAFDTATLRLKAGVEQSEGAENDIIYPGVRELIDELDAQGIDHGILTYATDVENQKFKLDIWHHCIGRSYDRIEAIITELDKKGEWIEDHWRDPRSTQNDPHFIVPSDLSENDRIRARYILIVDDKFKNIRSDHKHIIGYRVDNSANTPSASGGSVVDLLDILQRGTLMDYLQSKSTDA